MQETLVEIGGIPVSLELDDEDFSLGEKYGFFGARRVRSRMQWTARKGRFPYRLAPLSPAGKKPRRWEIKKRAGKKLFCLRYSPRHNWFWKVALMDPDFARGDIWVDPRRHEPEPFSFIDLLLWSHLLLLHGGLIIHAAALKDGSETYLFPARAGSGKSTWSRLVALCSGMEVLGDDKVILRRFPGGYKVYGSPWNLRLSAGEGWLRSIFFLEHSPENRMGRAASAATAATFKKMLQSAFLPFQGRKDMQAAAAVLSGLVEAVPARRFGFRPDESAVDFWMARSSL